MNDNHHPISGLYAQTSSLPLIESPSLYLPPPITLPQDLHPLPDDLAPYFVYPFTLEAHVLAHGPPQRAQAAQRQSEHVQMLLRREEDRRERERRELIKRAPGWAGTAGGVLVASKVGASATSTGAASVQDASSSSSGAAGGKSPEQAKSPVLKSLEEELSGLQMGAGEGPLL